MSEASLPLAGIRVIELGSSVAAPYAGSILAELGAEVIKVEKPGKGDDARGWGPPFHEGVGTIFHALNRNKRSITVDLADDVQRAALRKLIVESADVLIQNMRPGHAEQLGLGRGGADGREPRLVHATIAAFGQTGPLAQRPGYDPLMQAFGGLMGVTGEPGRPPSGSAPRSSTWVGHVGGHRRAGGAETAGPRPGRAGWSAPRSTRPRSAG